MIFSFSKKRAVNSYKTYVGEFIDKKDLSINVKWYIDDKLVLTIPMQISIIDNEIQWSKFVSIDDETKNYFNKALKLIAFG